MDEIYPPPLFFLFSPQPSALSLNFGNPAVATYLPPTSLLFCEVMATSTDL